jgi:hypothetical protein
MPVKARNPRAVGPSGANHIASSSFQTVCPCPILIL